MKSDDPIEQALEMEKKVVSSFKKEVKDVKDIERQPNLTVSNIVLKSDVKKNTISISTKSVMMFQTKLRLFTGCLLICFPFHLLYAINQYLSITDFLGLLSSHFLFHMLSLSFFYQILH